MISGRARLTSNTITMDLEKFRQYTHWNHVSNTRTYDAPAEPWNPLRIDPSKIEYYNQELRLKWGLGRVSGGGWDTPDHCRPLRETTIYRGLTQRFESGFDWEDTDLYRRAKAQFEEGNTVRGYESLDEYRSIRCKYIDELFHAIEQNGYRPNHTATHESATPENPFEEAFVHHIEPLVVIDRHGAIHLTEGFHRIIIASILDCDEVPVYALCRHAQWQSVRDQLTNDSVAESLADLEVQTDHPDIQNL